MTNKLVSFDVADEKLTLRFDCCEVKLDRDEISKVFRATIDFAWNGTKQAQPADRLDWMKNDDED